MTFEISIPSNPNCGARATVCVERGHVIARLRDRKWDLGPGNDFRAECIAAVWRDRLCDAPPPDLSGLHAGRDAGHYRSTGSASHLRYHPDNCHAQCVHCNRWGAGKAVDYRIRLIRRIGPARVEELEADNTPHKWQREELIAVRDTYRAKLKDIQKGETC